MRKALLIVSMGWMLVSCGGHKPKSGPENTHDALQYRKQPDSLPQDHTNVDNNSDNPVKNNR